MSYITLHLTCCIKRVNIILKPKQNHNTLIVYFEKSKTVSVASLIMKYIPALSALFSVPVKVSYIAFGLASSFCCLLKSIAISLWYFLKYG